MRPAEFPPEAIIQAGNELLAVGRNVTGFALRQRVGGGNPTRLRQVWDEHLAHNGAAHADPVAELPNEVAEEVAAITKALSERIATLAVELNDRTVKAAERRVAEVLRDAEEQRSQGERELADAAQTVEDIEGKLDAAQVENSVLQAKLAAALATLQAQAVELATLKTKAEVDQAAHAEQKQLAADELARAAERVADLETERNAAREDVARLRGQVEALQGQYTALLAALEKRPGA